MEKWLIIYSSNTGNTKKVAQAMYEALPENVVLTSIKDNPQIDDYDVIVVGYWVTRGGPEPMTRELLPKIKNKQVVLFQTLGADPISEHATTSIARAAYLLGEGCNLLGTFSSRGEINKALLEARKKLPVTNPHYPSEKNQKRWAAAVGHPDSADLDRARAFMVNMQNKLVMLEKYNAKK